MIDVAQLSTVVVSLLSPYLAKAAGKTAEELGGAVGARLVKLYDTLKAKLTRPGAAEALGDLEKLPGDTDAQAALRHQLKKALAEDEPFRRELQALVSEIQPERGGSINQTAVIHGNENTAIQIAGSGNVVGAEGKSS